MITLHESNITSFPLDNGIGVLSDAIIAYAEEELNGMFEFYMEYDSKGALVDEFKEERIIKAKAQDKLGYQLFRIYSITKNHENDNLIVNAQHITYDLANNFIEELKANRLTKKQVMEKIGASTVIPHPFNVTSSNTTTVSSTNLYRTNPLKMIGGMDGSVLQIWGGQIERDNFHLILHDRRGHDDGVTVRYAKNLTGLNAEFDISGLVTRIFPFVYIEATDDTPERLITVSGKYIDSPLINNYEKIYIEPIDYSHDERIDIQDKTDAQIRQQLESVASTYFEETGNDKVKAILDVNFMHLWETEEYKDVKVLELVGMGDTVTINHSRLKVDATAIVNYIRYDCIAHVNEEVKLGNVKAGLTDSVNKINRIEEKVNEVQNNANQAIVSANGKNTTYYGPDEPSSAQKGDLWFKVIDGQYHKTYRFDGIEWQLIIDMDSQEAKAEAQQAKDRADDAVNRANQATGDAQNAIEQAQESFNKAQENALELETLGLRFNDVEGNLTTISGTVDGLQTTVSDVQGNVANLTVISNAMQTRLSDAEGNINTLTLTSKSLQSTISSLQTELDELEVGDRNLVLESNKGWRSTEYNVIQGYLSEDWIVGETYTVILKGNINDGQVFRVWRDRGSTAFVALEYNKEKDLWIGTDVARETSRSEKNRFSVYNFPNSGATEAEVEWIKIVRGNKTSLDWTPAPEDLATQTQITQLSDAINLRVAKGDVINQINLDTSGVLISGKKLILDGDTTVLGTFKLDGSAHIQDASIGTAQIGTIDAAIANIINISANSIVGGILSSQNSTTTFNLNTGELHMDNADITLGGGAIIKFESSGNRINYSLYDSQSNQTRTAGLGVGTGSSGRYPFVHVGTTTGGQTNTLHENYSGFIAVTTRSILEGGSNSITGQRLQFRNRAVGWEKGLEFDFFGDNPYIRPINGHEYEYDLGTSAYRFKSAYVERIRAASDFMITHYSSTSGAAGWRLETNYSGEGNDITLRGINGGTYEYQIGRPTTNNRIRHIFLKNSPNVSSDERLKTDIANLDLGLDFINRIEAKKFRLKQSQAQLLRGVDKNPIQYGIIAQQVNTVLADFGVSDSSLITQCDDGYYGAQYEQFIAPLIKSVQELDIKLTDNVEFLKLKVQYLEQKLESQNKRIKQLEGVA